MEPVPRHHLANSQSTYEEKQNQSITQSCGPFLKIISVGFQFFLGQFIRPDRLVFGEYLNQLVPLGCNLHDAGEITLYQSDLPAEKAFDEDFFPGQDIFPGLITSRKEPSCLLFCLLLTHESILYQFAIFQLIQKVKIAFHPADLLA